MKSILLNTFAVIGFGTFIFLACSVDDIDSTENNNNNSEIITNNYGKYQMTNGASTNLFHVLDTETGVVKTFYTSGVGNQWTNGNAPYQLIYTTDTN
jgi:hypothetical protein